ncbi:hypothetical protein HanXRQr2_Chr05g0220341 [Helianthus annuus]|uniref:Uncharacterized protein n=1 Tax=Helianthus annuus TaxID=4232 RepID=A0A9K3J024_HELAN|nr:hypothetical protein HanXRQr2_Chr05g0220341 [Helianthus annuus]
MELISTPIPFRDALTCWTQKHSRRISGTKSGECLDSIDLPLLFLGMYGD